MEFTNTWAVRFFKSSHDEGHAPLLLLFIQFELPDNPVRPGKFPPIQPLHPPAADVAVVVLVTTGTLLLLTPRPGGGPRADFIGNGAPHNSDALGFCWMDPSDQLFTLDVPIFATALKFRMKQKGKYY